MRHTYEYGLVDGHIVAIDAQSRLLIDTGAPSSVSDSAHFDFAARSHPAKKNYLGVSLESISESIGTSVDALVGADVLNQYDSHIDPVTCTITVSDGHLPLHGGTVPVDSFMGIPVVDAVVGQDRLRMFFDTGAKLSYLDAERTAPYTETGTAEDFYPGLGAFSTRVYEVPIVLGSETIMDRVGNLPQVLRMTLIVANVRGILGTVLLRTHSVTFAPRRRVLAVSRIGSQTHPSTL